MWWPMERSHPTIFEHPSFLVGGAHVLLQPDPGTPHPLAAAGAVPLRRASEDRLIDPDRCWRRRRGVSLPCKKPACGKLGPAVERYRIRVPFFCSLF